MTAPAPTPPTVVERWNGPDTTPRCPECRQYPDLSRVTCLTCLTGRAPGFITTTTEGA